MPVLVPIVRQRHDYSCGAACLASCLSYWGLWENTGESELYSLLGTTTAGTSAAQITDAAKEYGLDVDYQIQLTLKDLQRIVDEGKTAILSVQAWGDYPPGADLRNTWESGHYVVLVNATNSHVTVMDPDNANGSYRTLQLDQFNRGWHDWSDDGEAREYGAAIILNLTTQ
jgi:predicted double-glycine peptidase